MIKLLTFSNIQATNKAFIAVILFAVLGGCFFVKKAPLKPLFESPLPNPSLSISQDCLFIDPSIELEYKLAKSFIQEKALSPALASFKRTSFLTKDPVEKSAANYGLIYTYFLAKKWDALHQLYISGILDQIDQSAPYFNDLLWMFYIALKEKQLPFVCDNIKSYLCQNKDVEKKLQEFEAITTASFEKSAYKAIYQNYLHTKKSSALASFLNLIVPGSGYLYLGQYQSALTAFVLLSLLLWALHSCFSQKQKAAAFLVFSVFVGFYWGSIVGVTESCKLYNQSLYTFYFEPILVKEKLYPESQITYAP